jgi:RNA polymerase sigma-70 factor (ECF subfamily)
VRREQAVLLADALGQLPGDYREVIILRHLEERPLAEVAHHLGRNVDSVRKLWTRALLRLRRALEEPSHTESVPERCLVRRGNHPATG